MPDSPNILLIMTDQHRYDALGHVNQRIKTPHLDQLAREGTRFTRAYTPCSLCTPARASILTGLYPHDHGLLTNNDMYHVLNPELHDRVQAFSSLLRTQGWNCGYVGKWHVGHDKLPSTFGFEGMDIPDYGKLDDYAPYLEYLKKNGLEKPGRSGLTWTGPSEATVPWYLTEVARDMVKRYAKEEQPFCLWLNYWGPHAPYFCEEPYASMYDPASIPEWPNFRDSLEGKPNTHRRFIETGFEGSRDKPWEHWRELVAKYWGKTTAIDAQIGRLLETLRETGCAENTLVVFTTDHGDATGMHGGLFDKGSHMYEETMHIPMITRWPERIAAGGQCGEFVSLLDLMPTFLDLAGIDAPYELAGSSLLPLLAGEQKDWRDCFVAEWHGHRFLNSQRMLRQGTYKYVFTPGNIDELYDLDADPHEFHNLIDNPDHSTTLESLRRRLMQHLLDEKDPLRFGAASFLPGAEGIPRPELVSPDHLRLR